MSDAIVTRRDLERYLEDHGLALVYLDQRASPLLRLTVRGAVSGDAVVRHPPLEERAEELRRALREQGVLGVHWTVTLYAGPGPYRTPGGGG